MDIRPITDELPEGPWEYVAEKPAPKWFAFIEHGERAVACREQPDMKAAEHYAKNRGPLWCWGHLLPTGGMCLLGRVTPRSQ